MGKYTAFISYRHLSPDADIAKKLHSMIENFGIPGAIKKKTGMKKMGRVFRDQDELPLSADLGDDIRRALEESDWLICVCSPRYPESRWCMEEVRYFLSMGKRDHILTILTAGEPEESFPEELMFQTVDGKTVEKEPLAADVRADDTAGMLKELKALCDSFLEAGFDAPGFDLIVCREGECVFRYMNGYSDIEKKMPKTYPYFYISCFFIICV